jgi:hypothetical protein
VIGVGTLLLVLALGLLITRVATVALRTTGLSHESARFQARSAFSGVGFTTAESEDIVSHPARRRIVTTLMLLSSAGVVTTLASLMLSFGGEPGVGQTALRVAALGLGLLLLWRISASERVEARLSTLIERVLRRVTDLDVRDYVRLLHIGDDHSVAEIGVEEGDWLECKELGDLQLSQEGIVVLGLRHADGTYTGAPSDGAPLEIGDVVIVYGRTDALDALERRPLGADGDEDHRRAVAIHELLDHQPKRRVDR